MVRYTEHAFLHPVRSTCPIVHSGASGGQNVDALFFMLGWDRYGFHKKCAGIHYAELVFLHLMGYVGHVVLFGVSRRKKSMHYFARSGKTDMDSIKSGSGHVTPNMSFCIRWDLWVR
jgi:hypothetical protein